MLKSKEDLCINDKIDKSEIKGTALDQVCEMMRKAEGDHSCSYYKGVSIREPIPKKIQDIEDLIVEGKRYGYCPYFT